MLFEVAVVAGQLDIQPGHRHLGSGVQQQRVDLAQGVVTSHPGHRPGVGEPLSRLGDLLDRDPAGRGGSRQPFEVSARIGQAVGVVNPQTCHVVLGHPAQDLAVGLVEHRRVLHPQAGQVRYREEPAVVLLRVRPAEADQLVVLAVVHRGGGALARPGGDRIPVLVVAEHAVGNGESRVGLVTKHWDQDPAIADLPVDVEPAGERRLLADSQHVPPGVVLLRNGHTHVVGHDVDDQPQTDRVAGSGQGGQPGIAAAVRIDEPMVNAVVSMAGSGGR